VDSFDSADPAHSTNGRYDPAKAKANGNIFSSSGAVGVETSARVWGHIWFGPGGSAYTTGTGAVGDFNWHFRGIQPEWALAGSAFTAFDVNPPYSFAPQPSPGVIISGGSTNYFDYLLTGGFYILLTNASGNIGVTAPSIVYASNGFSGGITVATGGRLTLVVGNICSIYGGDVADGSVTNLSILGLANLTSMTTGSQPLIGTIYAPRAQLKIFATPLIGSALADSILVYGHAAVHYDEQLSRGLPRMLATLTQLNISSTNGIQFSVIGSPGLEYAVQASTNLTDWVSIQTNVSPFVATDPDAFVFPNRYYRAVSVP
jgi:hypothetical protein